MNQYLKVPHRTEKGHVEVTLFQHKIKGVECKDCSVVVFGAEDAQELFDKIKKEETMSTSDIILALFYAQKDVPIKGMISLMKQSFLVEKEFTKEEHIKSEDGEYIPYKYGPYSYKVDEIVSILEENEIIKSYGRKSSNKEIFYLTDFGNEIAEKVFSKLTSEQQRKLSDLRKGWDQLGINGILKRVYMDYKNYLNNSVILSKILPEYKVVRSRG
ncbi:MAG: hypothetical protein KAT05_15800 [Spirochaetes bacterium]|nr:hypothetical protein [Spirochaetota bacterium]